MPSLSPLFAQSASTVNTSAAPVSFAAARTSPAVEIPVSRGMPGRKAQTEGRPASRMILSVTRIREAVFGPSASAAAPSLPIPQTRTGPSRGIFILSRYEARRDLSARTKR